MIEWEVADDHLRIVDGDDVTVTVSGADLTVHGDGSSIPRPVEETIDCTASSLRLRMTAVTVDVLDRNEQYDIIPAEGPITLPDEEYVVDVDTGIKTYLRFVGPAEVRTGEGDDNVVISFPDERTVTLGFRSRHRLPTSTITVPPTPEGLATAISHLSVSIKTDSPDRTYPTLRGHPPLLQAGTEIDIPEPVADRTGESDVRFVVPPRWNSLYVISPLAYYLGATVETDERDEAVVQVPDLGVEARLGRRAVIEQEVENLFRRTFFLECLVRNAGPYGTQLAESNILDLLDLDGPSLYDSTIGERLATYLEVPHAAVAHRLPDWHLSTYVEASAEYFDVVPYLLDRLSLVYRPRTSELDGKELVERSLDAFYRGPRAGAGQVASVDIVKPELRGGRVHGWLADGVPIDVFKSTPTAYRNRLEYVRTSDESTSIAVVLNDPEMAGEHEKVAAIYRQRGEDLDLEVTVDESLDTGSLARTFEAENDFVHYIGHCETDGLRCPDGFLDLSSIEECNAETFFLNACGSFYEGMTLIEKGSVAGAVTFTQVLNEHAVKVGSTFAKLLVHGFSFERAMRLARRRIMMGKDYAVVGDGTHTLTQGVHRLPTTLEIEPIDEEFLLTLDCFSTQETGGYYFPHAPENEYAYLCGTESTFAFDRENLASFLRDVAAPTIYDGDVYWSEELSTLFAD